MAERSPDRMPAAARWTLGSILVTNIGNGMQSLTVGKLLYDRTGSAAAFGSVFIAEYAINFLVQVLAGPLVDRNEPKRVVVLTDLLRGCLVLLAAAMLGGGGPVYVWVLASVLAVNLGKPFYRSATFTIGPALTRDRALVRYNAYSDGLQQGGQLLGIALAGILIQRGSLPVPFALNGISYLVAAAMVAWARIPREALRPRRERLALRLGDIARDWQEILGALRSDLSFASHLVLAAVDYVSVNLLSVLVVPMVHDWHGGNPLLLSAFEGAFAIGAVAGALLIGRARGGIASPRFAAVGLAGQAASLGALSVVHAAKPTVALIVACGIFNTLSFTCLISTLQQRSRGPMRGRIAAARNLVTGALAAVMIPAVTLAQGSGTAHGLEAAGAMMAFFTLVTMGLGARPVFGPALLGLEPLHAKAEG